MKRLERQEQDQKLREQAKVLERDDQARMKEQKIKDTTERVNAKNRRKEILMLKKKKKAEDSIERNKVLEKNARMTQWLREGVKESDLDSRELEYNR